ncbi:putative carboxylesterase [Talaromyces proteolyticus]|uniref:Carboxylesterase n=1 Tax=Talaromyces proteolyticus TaxID=1131652 RepID=A0AAD4KSP4_9EURO|nr:putative carboxylesterase [Talaromyces proteolyticus]KAH8697482.1 putative carboxylesterase [Talaromyces proteolyticus]
MSEIMKFTRMLAVCASAATIGAVPFRVGQTVHTTSGSIQGHAAPGVSDVSEYLSIPFVEFPRSYIKFLTLPQAKPPVGDLRWEPPQPFNGTSQINAEKFGASCPAHTGINMAALGNYSQYGITPQGAEIIVSFLGQTTDVFSEDCLTLNVWAKPQTREDKKAVMFWVYGGSYSSGGSDIPAYNGKYLADQEDVIVVSANYRLNIFGFPGGPTISNNLGLLDQRRAIEWVRDNIEGFGGDPNRITMFGESAGGSSVDYYSYAWTSDPIVAGFIAESGTVFSPDTQASAASSATNWYAVSQTLGCGDASGDPASVLSCMRSKSWQDVLNAIPAASKIPGASASFGPTIDNIIVFSDYISRSVNGNLIKRPMMIGNNNWEPGLFQPMLAVENITLPSSTWAFLMFSLFTCPTSYRALAGQVNKVPTWRYRYFGNFPNMQLSTPSENQGAWHGSEIPMVFGTDMDIQDKVARTAEEEIMSTYMRKAWTTFAKDPVNGLVQYGFPEYNANGNTLIQLAINNETSPNPTNPAQYDTGCPIVTALVDLLTAL